MSETRASDLEPASPVIDRASAILGALRQDAIQFQGLSTREVERERAEIFASLASREIPSDVLPVIIEELRTSLSPIILAGVARAVMGSGSAETEVVGLLKAAVARIALTTNMSPSPLIIN